MKLNLDISKLNTVVEMLLAGEKLPEKYQDHSLSGNWSGHRECHVFHHCGENPNNDENNLV